MPRLSVSIMAHRQRETLVAGLVDQLGVGADRVTWDRHENRWDTGRRAWEGHDPAADWHLVIQDDAMVCADLLPGLEKALDHVPEQAIVSLYVGTRRPAAEQVQRAVALADKANAAWIVMGPLNWGVALCVPTGLIGEMLAWCDEQPYPNYDRRIGQFFRQVHTWPTWHTWPTLVDHRDVPSLVGHGGERSSHRFLGENTSALDVDWAGPVVDFAGRTLAVVGGGTVAYRVVGACAHASVYSASGHARQLLFRNQLLPPEVSDTDIEHLLSVGLIEPVIDNTKVK